MLLMAPPDITLCEPGSTKFPILSPQGRRPPYSEHMATFDYIIVGSGSAGSVLANRLSIDPEISVLVLEAGGSDKHLNVDTPAAFSKLFQTKRDWNYHTMPEPCMDERQVYLPRGKMLGGSSSMNAMIYIRGHRSDYDGWRDAGCEGWGYDDVLPYFKKAEHNERIEDEFHGKNGPLNVADLRSPNELSETFVAAAGESGLGINPDFNGREQEGAGLYQVTQKKGSRWSTSKAYLRPARDRANLTVETNALVHRVTFDGDRATGVEYAQDGEVFVAAATREVILSAGALNTPQILMLSGVGPQKHLTDMGIQVVFDNPNVGQHLQDHPVILMIFSVAQPVSLHHAEEPRQLAEYLIKKKGMLSSNVGEAGAFVRTDGSKEPPDIQFHFAPGVFIRHGFETLDHDGMSLGPTLVNPQSRGSILLRSTDPEVHPDIVTMSLQHPDDMASLVEGFRLGRKIVAAEAFAKYQPVEVIPGPDAQTDEEIASFIRERSELLYHPSCTARMGREASAAVVDSQLRVFGVQGLRVVDASVMPTVTRGNTNAPTIMIAEKAADMILSDNSA